MGMKPRVPRAFREILDQMYEGFRYTTDELTEHSSPGAVYQTLIRMQERGYVRRVNPGSYGQGVKAVYQLTAKGCRYHGQKEAR